MFGNQKALEQRLEILEAKMDSLSRAHQKEFTSEDFWKKYLVIE